MSAYQKVVVEWLAETLHNMSMDMIRLVASYVFYPTATAGKKPNGLLTIGAKGEFLGHTNCWSVTCAPDHRLWVCCGSKVLVFSPEGQFLHYAPPDYGNWVSTTGIAFGPDGEAYIADYGADWIGICRPDGIFLRRFPCPTGKFLGPNYVAVDSKQRLLFLSETQARRVQVMNLDGSLVRSIRPTDGEFVATRGVAVNGSEVCVVDYGSSARVRFTLVLWTDTCPPQVFNYDGQFLRTMGAGGDAAASPSVSHGPTASDEKHPAGGGAGGGQSPPTLADESAQRGLLKDPVGVAIDAMGNWFVTDIGHRGVVVFAASGSFLTSFDVGMGVPSGVCVDHSGRILVCCRGNVNVFVF